MHGLRALDLGCGQGYFTRALAAAGAQAAGVDFAEELVTYARAHEARAPLGAEYHVLSASAIERHLPRGSIDLVTACMSLQDMADVEATVHAAFAVLAPRGRMVFSVPHPGTDTPVREWERDAMHRKAALKIDRYFDTGPAVCQWNMPRLLYSWDTPYWRFTLSEWSALIARAGFVIQRLHEPRPTEAQVRNNPKLADCYRLPYCLIFDLVKAP